MLDKTDPQAGSLAQVKLRIILDSPSARPQRSAKLNHAQVIGNLRKKRLFNRSAFGRETHKFKLKSKLSLDAILSVESNHDIVLPSDYKEFLLNVGDGGAGPGYGLLPLMKSVDKATEDIADSLRIPFRYQKFYNPADEEDFHAREAEDGYWDSFLVGSMPICHEGCGYYHILILSGEAKGAVWLNGMSSDMGITPLSESFSEWYSKWLEHLDDGGNGVWWMN